MGSVCTPPVDASSAGATSSCTDETSTASSARSRRWRRARARGSSASVRGLVRDLSTVDGAKGLVEEVLREHGDVDAVFNNAGVYATTFERTADGNERTFAVNAVAPYVIAGGLIPMLVRNAKASGVKSSLLNVASISAAPRLILKTSAER